MDEIFNQFMETVDEKNRGFVGELNEMLVNNNCKCNIKSAKSGYVVSYVRGDTKRTLANFVFRKTGIKIRIYADNISAYQELLNQLPEKMKVDIRKASICKRLVNPEDCNPKCPMGYTFVLDGIPYQKCRNMAFMPTLNEENNPFIKMFLEKELEN